MLKKINTNKDSGKSEAVYSKLSGYSVTKVLETNIKSLIPFEVPQGMAVSKTFEIFPGRVAQYMLQATYRLGREDEKGLIIPQGERKAYIMVPINHESFLGLMEYGKIRIQAYETAKMIKNSHRYNFD